MMSERMQAAEKLIDVLLGASCNTSVAGSAHPASAAGAPRDPVLVAPCAHLATGVLQDAPSGEDSSLRDEAVAPLNKALQHGSRQVRTRRKPKRPRLPALPPASSEMQRSSQPGPIPLLDDEGLQRHLLSLLRAGFSRRLAALELNIHPSTVGRAIKRDPEFAQQVLKAEEQFTRAPILCLLQAACKSWRAAAWVMKNYHPHDSVTRRNDRRDTKFFLKKQRDLYAATEE